MKKFNNLTSVPRDNIIPSSTRAASSFSQRSYEKYILKAPSAYLEQMFKVLSNVFLNATAEYFHFIKFRCIIESGLFDDSANASSEDELKECIDSIQRTIDTNRSKQRKDSISYLILVPSFVNLLNSIEDSVKARYYRKMIKNIFALDKKEKIKKIVEIIDRINKRVLFCVFNMNFRSLILLNNKDKNILRSLIKNINNDIAFRYKKSFEQ